MPIIYKKEILAALKEAGYSSYKLRNEKIFGERTIQQLRNNELASWATIEKLCKILNCQPGDLLEYEEEDQD
jgi:putative transcriptional regulator